MPGFATGRVVLETLAERGITVAQWRWRYAPELRRSGGRFPPHYALRTQVFDHEVSASDPTPDGFYPGDHAGDSASGGCQCDIVPLLRSATTGRFVPREEGVNG